MKRSVIQLGIQVLRGLSSGFPRSTFLGLWLARLYSWVGDEVRTQQQLHRVLARHPDCCAALVELGHSQVRRGQPSESIAAYTNAMLLRPENAELPFCLGNAWYESGDVRRAIIFYQATLRLRPRHARAYFNLGHAFKRLGQLEQSAEAFQGALNVEPRFYKARFMRAYVLSLMGRTAEAVQEYRQTIRHSRTYVKAYYNLGNCYLKQGDYLDAIHCYRMVLRLDRTYDKAYFALGQGYLQAGNLRRARTAFANALRLRPDRHTCRLQLARVLVRMNRKTEAILHYRVFLRDAPEGPEHVEVRRCLQEFRQARTRSSPALAAAS